MRRFTIYTTTTCDILLVCHIKEDNMGKICGKYKGEDKGISGFKGERDHLEDLSIKG